MWKVLLLSCLLMSWCGCRSMPFKVEPLSAKKTTIEQTDQKLLTEFEAVIDAGMGDRYRKKKSPSFGLIQGYYRLPQAKPYGSVSIVRSYSYQTYFEGIEVKKNEHAYAIESIGGDDALAYNQALNSLLNIGVKIKEIGMADALNIAKAEASAAKSDQIFMPAKLLPPGVDYLISIYPASSKRGPVLIGRVIKKDGTLMAFRTIYRGSGNSPVGGLIISLFEDTIARI